MFFYEGWFVELKVDNILLLGFEDMLFCEERVLGVLVNGCKVYFGLNKFEDIFMGNYV